MGSAVSETVAAGRRGDNGGRSGAAGAASLAPPLPRRGEVGRDAGAGPGRTRPRISFYWRQGALGSCRGPSTTRRAGRFATVSAMSLTNAATRESPS